MRSRIRNLTHFFQSSFLRTCTFYFLFPSPATLCHGHALFAERALFGLVGFDVEVQQCRARDVAEIDFAAAAVDEHADGDGDAAVCLDDVDAARIQGKNILLLDDVISTGGSMKALCELTEKAGGNIIGQACVLAEGDAAKRDDIIFLEALPLFDAE